MTDKTITSFLFDGEITVRVIERNAALWFVASDVCCALGLTNPTETVRYLDEDERGLSTAETVTGLREMVIVNESGLYNLIFKSQTPNAAHFRKWVTAVVLPALRIAGHYHLIQPINLCGQPDAGKVRLVSEARQVFGERAAGQLWFFLGLPVVSAMHLAPAQSDLFMVWAPPDGLVSPTA